MADLDAECPGPGAPGPGAHGAGPGKIKCVQDSGGDNITGRKNRASISGRSVFRDPGAIV